MLRIVALLFCAVAAFAALAAPAPVYKLERDRWLGIDGWDKPVDPVGGCRFVRDCGRLTIRLPEGHSREQGIREGRKDVPHILRVIEGDFDLQVRIMGEFGLPEGICEDGNFRNAGLMLDAGKVGCFSERSTWVFNGRWTHRFMGFHVVTSGAKGSWGELSPRGATSYHRLSRRGDRVSMSASIDGKQWCQLRQGDVGVLPRVVKVGVFAWKSGPIPFQAVFDEFKLTPLK